MIQLNAENIKTHLRNGDQVLINGDGPYIVRDFAPNTKFDDLGFQINDGICDPHYGVITDGSIRRNRFRIINLGEKYHMTQIDHTNIKSELSVGDQIQVDGKGPYRVTFLYWEIEGNEEDHGVDIDDPNDDFLGVICGGDVTSGYHEIIKV